MNDGTFNFDPNVKYVQRGELSLITTSTLRALIEERDELCQHVAEMTDALRVERRGSTLMRLLCASTSPATTRRTSTLCLWSGRGQTTEHKADCPVGRIPSRIDQALTKRQEKENADG